jgi:hypothetical protein
MEEAAEALSLEVAGLRAAFADIDGAIEKRRPIVVFALKPSEDADALKRFLGPLLTRRDDRSDWQAMRDSWRLRHFSTCFGLVDKSGYRWRIEETEAHIGVTFEPGDEAPSPH